MDINELDNIRADIAKIDNSIVDLLIKRFQLTDEIGAIKKLNGIAIENKELEAKILARCIDRIGNNTSRESIMKIYKEIFSQSKERQKKL